MCDWLITIGLVLLIVLCILILKRACSRTHTKHARKDGFCILSGKCSTDSDCCKGSCVKNECTKCLTKGKVCENDHECCSTKCKMVEMDGTKKCVK